MGVPKVTLVAVQPVLVTVVTFPGQLIVGAWVSLTVTLKLHNALLPEPSVTLNVFTVTPVGKVAPLASPAVWIVDAPEQLSVPTGAAYVTTAPHTLLSLPVMIFDGQLIEGSTLSVTVTSWAHLAVLPAPSVTVQITVVVPAANVAGALLVVEDTLQLSVVTGVPKATPVAVQPLLVITLTFRGQVMTGTTLSVTITSWVQLAVRPASSVTVHVTVVVPNK